MKIDQERQIMKNSENRNSRHEKWDNCDAAGNEGRRGR
jgi:hypothetical protein